MQLSHSWCPCMSAMHTEVQPGLLLYRLLYGEIDRQTVTSTMIQTLCWCAVVKRELKLPWRTQGEKIDYLGGTLSRTTTPLHRKEAVEVVLRLTRMASGHLLGQVIWGTTGRRLGSGHSSLGWLGNTSLSPEMSWSRWLLTGKSETCLLSLWPEEGTEDGWIYNCYVFEDTPIGIAYGLLVSSKCLHHEICINFSSPINLLCTFISSLVFLTCKISSRVVFRSD